MEKEEIKAENPPVSLYIKSFRPKEKKKKSSEKKERTCGAITFLFFGPSLFFNPVRVVQLSSFLFYFFIYFYYDYFCFIFKLLPSCFGILCMTP